MASPWYSFLIPQFEKQKQEIKSEPDIQLSASGTEIYGGYTEEEFLGKLRDPRRRYEIYHQMRSDSGVLKMCIKSVKDPIRGVEWGIRPKVGEEETPDAIAQQEFLQKALDVNRLYSIVNDAVTSVVFGFYLGELYFKPFSYNGSIRLMPNVKMISQRTINRWAISPDSEWEGVEQLAYGDTAIGNAQRFITSDRLVHMAIDQEGDNYEGISMLRASYGNWVRKNANYKKIAIGNHFLALPFLMFKPSEMTTPSPDSISKLDSNLKRRAADGKALSHMVLPTGWNADEQSTNFDPLKLYECNSKEDEEIVRSFCANFLLLTRGAGSHALSNDLSDFFLKGLEEIAKLIDKMIDEHIIKRTIYVNFDQECLVECYHSEVGGKGGLKLSQALSSLLNSKALTMDDTLEGFIRNKFGLPKQDMDTARQNVPETPFGQTKGNSEDNSKEEVSSEAGQVELATKGGLKSQAEKSRKRILGLQKEVSESFQLGTKEIIEKQAEKAVAFWKKNKGTQKIYKVKVDDFKVSPNTLIKSVTDTVMGAYNDEAKELMTSMRLATKKTKASVVAMFRSMADSDIQDVISKMDNALLYALIESADAVDNPEILKSLLIRSATTSIDTAVTSGKMSVLPAKVVNTARQQTFEEQLDEIESYTFYNPSPQAAICQYLAGRTIMADDPDVDRYSTPLHFNCATVILPNMKTFKNNPTTERLTPSKGALKSINIGVKSL